MSEASVLVVDDNQKVRDILHRTLSSLGYAVRVVEGGRAAVEAIQRSPDCFSVVLLDVKMPELDGPQTFLKIREIRPDLPVIYMTAYSEIPKAELLASGASAVVEKPFDIEQISKLLREYCEPTTSQRRQELLARTRDELVAKWQSKPRFQGMTPPREVNPLADGIIE